MESSPLDRAALPPIEAVIFDCDGTLVDSEVISLKVLVELVELQGLSIPHQQAVHDWSGCDLQEVIQEIESELGHPLPANFLETFRQRQLAQLADRVKPIAGASELLQDMRLPFCVASNAPQNKIRLCLKTTGLSDFIESDRIFSAYDIQAWKPRPDLFLHAAKQLGRPPQACAVVEDSGVGLDAGLSAGMTVFGFDPHGRLPFRDGTITVRRLEQLKAVFQA